MLVDVGDEYVYRKHANVEEESDVMIIQRIMVM